MSQRSSMTPSEFVVVIALGLGSALLILTLGAFDVLSLPLFFCVLMATGGMSAGVVLARGSHLRLKIRLYREMEIHRERAEAMEREIALAAESEVAIAEARESVVRAAEKAREAADAAIKKMKAAEDAVAEIRSVADVAAAEFESVTEAADEVEAEESPEPEVEMD